MSGIMLNIAGGSFAGPPGQDAYITAGTFTWVAPAGVTKVSVVAVGGGGATAESGCPPNQAGGGGGALAYANNITVIPGNSYTAIVGAKGFPHFPHRLRQQ